MNSYIKTFILLSVIFLTSVHSSDAQTKYKFSKPPKFTLTFALSYNYALARSYGDLRGANVIYDSLAGGYVFAGKNYGMLQGGSFMTIGKLAIDKKRQVRLTLNLGYGLFYNNAFDDLYKNQWHLFSGAIGIEVNMAPKARYRPYVGYELMYTLMFGSWQYGITSPTGEVSSLFIKFKPAHRFGMAFNSGVEYMISKKAGVTFGGRVVWVNAAPKMNKPSSDPNKVYINDAGVDNGIDLGYRKQIVYFQFVAGASLFIGRK